MNIPDLGSLYGSRNVTPRETTEPAATDETAQTAPQETSDTAATATSNTRDEYAVSEERQRISDLVDTVENTGEEVRQERVQQARERVASGYYNSDEFLGRLALQIVAAGEVSA